MAKFYAGIGARKTPELCCEDMTIIAGLLADWGYTLRSGHADGADLAFEKGCIAANGNKEIFIPWGGYNGHTAGDTSCIIAPHTREHEFLARTYHPNWKACDLNVRLLLARNGCQILGRNLDSPVDFVVCWTPNASGAGGTGQALRIARAHHIPIYDLADLSQAQALAAFIEGLSA